MSYYPLSKPERCVIVSSQSDDHCYNSDQRDALLSVCVCVRACVCVWGGGQYCKAYVLE